MILMIKQLLMAFIEQGMMLFRVNRSASHSVLVYRPDAIGDFLLWLPSAQSLVKYYAEKDFDITLLGNDSWSQFAEKQKIFDNVRSINRKKLENSLYYRLSLILWLRRKGFSEFIYPVFSREFFLGDEIVRLSGARLKVGYSGDSSCSLSILNKLGRKYFYDELIDYPSAVSHEVQLGRFFVEKLTGRSVQNDFPLVYKKWDSGCWGIEKPYFILAPGAGQAIKMWPVEKYAQLVTDIVQSKGWAAVLVGGASECGLGQSLRSHCGIDVIDLIGKTDLEQCCSLIEGAEVVIGNDSANVHLAAALNTPSVCILGGGSTGRFLPYPVGLFSERLPPRVVLTNMSCAPCDWHCDTLGNESGPAPCMSSVEVKDVLKAIDEPFFHS